MTLTGSTFVCALPGSTLDCNTPLQSVLFLYSLTVVILSDNPFAFDTSWKYFCLQYSTAIILIVILPGSDCLDTPFNFGIPGISVN